MLKPIPLKNACEVYTHFTEPSPVINPMVHKQNHETYYPNSLKMLNLSVKMRSRWIFSKTRKILQSAGGTQWDRQHLWKK